MSTVLENYLNTQQAAVVIGCDPSHVRRMLIDGTLKGKKVGGRAWLVPLREARRMARMVPATGRPRKGS